MTNDEITIIIVAYKCDDIITEIDGFHHDFDIIDAAVLISTE